MLLATNMIDLIETTHTRHYQLFKTKRLNEMGLNTNDESNGTTIFDLFIKKHAEFVQEIQHKEFEIKENFVKKVKDKENEIKNGEKEVIINKTLNYYVLLLLEYSY